MRGDSLRDATAARIKKQLGGEGDFGEPFPERPKGMHQRTYERLLKQVEEAERPHDERLVNDLEALLREHEARPKASRESSGRRRPGRAANRGGRRRPGRPTLPPVARIRAQAAEGEGQSQPPPVAGRRAPAFPRIRALSEGRPGRATGRRRSSGERHHVDLPIRLCGGSIAHEAR